MSLAPIPQVIEAIRAGRMVVLVDDDDRENEGDLVIAAEHANAAAIAFMATRGCGLICLAMEGPMLDRLGLPLMTRSNRSKLGTAFTLSIEAAEGVTTGISAADRAHTVQTAIADSTRPEHLVSPGHVFPLRAVEGGVLVRAGHSEASVDLARLAGLKPAAVICEIMRPDGEMARLADLKTYCAEHGLLLASIADLIAWRERSESLVQLSGEARLETRWGPVQACSWRSLISGEEHLSLSWGQRLSPGAEIDDPVLVRVQQELVLTDAFHLEPAQPQITIDAVMERIAAAGEGVLLYIRDGQGGRLPGQLEALGGRRVLPPLRPRLGIDAREYGIGAQILRLLGVRRMRLLTASDRHLIGLGGHGLEVVERVGLEPAVARTVGTAEDKR